jgi:DNA-binding response OmpR family regulator
LPEKKKILIVEDDRQLEEVLKLRLLSEGFEVLSSYDGESGLAQARRQKPDLIILDLMLPKLDGYKVCRMLKFDKKYKNIPVILFTSRADEKDKELGLGVGADAYITKFLEPQILLDKIRELLNPGER